MMDIIYVLDDKTTEKKLRETIAAIKDVSIAELNGRVVCLHVPDDPTMKDTLKATGLFHILVAEVERIKA